MDWTFEDGKRAAAKMRERASCRSFADRPIEEDVLNELLGVALCAASGGNLQPFSILLLDKKGDNEKISKICGEQAFMAQAPVNLLFLLDWHKMKIYAKNQNAPFSCDRSFMHFIIALEDVVCAAQSVETAAHLMGLGACYVGTTNTAADELAAEYRLPRGVFPTLLLSLGYPKIVPAVRKKLGADIMIFRDRYPDMSDDFVVGKYAEKYGDSSTALPAQEPYRSQTLELFADSLSASFGAEEAAEILKTAAALGRINETQRRFGTHYPAKMMIGEGRRVIEMMRDQGALAIEE